MKKKNNWQHLDTHGKINTILAVACLLIALTLLLVGAKNVNWHILAIYSLVQCGLLLFVIKWDLDDIKHKQLLKKIKVKK